VDSDQQGGQPAGTPPPAVRASDRDRERALELLSIAASDGRLTLEEYSTRADHALGARLIGELSELTGDLQRSGVSADPTQLSEVAPPEPQRLVAILSNETRKGRWTVPAHLELRSVLGDCHIELQDAVLTSHVTKIDASTTLGAVTIFVPDGVEVRLFGRSILGAKTSEVSEEALPGAPVIEVRANAILGNITVKPAEGTQRIRGHLSGGG
jgi:Domain of unknown function (DUF1707)/Cell wall-active antibiotics response 4TMS YvqF